MYILRSQYLMLEITNGSGYTVLASSWEKGRFSALKYNSNTQPLNWNKGVPMKRS